MKMLALSLALLAAAGPALAAGDAPSPGLLAKIQLPTQAIDGGNGGVSTKKVGALDVSKFDHHGDIGQQLQVDINSANSPRPPAAIGKAIGGHANDGDQD
jgi:hypothetical protein